ncbi:MAG: hypothetical protein ABSF03_26245, partial [Streptosporangiaceae bacterium]
VAAGSERLNEAAGPGPAASPCCAGPGGATVLARGATPRNPPHALRAPLRYFADIPATRRA